MLDVHSRLQVTGVRIVDCVLMWDELPANCQGSCPTVFGYNVYRSETESGEYLISSENVDATSVSVSDNAWYRVSAITSEGESDLSDAVQAHCGSPIPPPPPVLEVVDCVLVWSAVEGALYYNVHKGDVIFSGITETEFPVSDNACYRVSAVTPAGPTELSNEVCVECAPIPSENEVWRSRNGDPFELVYTFDGTSETDPILLLGTDSAPTDIISRWNPDNVVHDTPVFFSGDVLCYKVRQSQPTEGNFSNEACAVRDKLFLGTGAVSYPTWQLAFGDFSSDDITLVTSLDLSGLRAVIGGTLYLDASFVLTALDLSSLVSISGEFHLSLTTITTLSLPEFTTLGGDLFFDNTSLVDISFPQFVFKNGQTYAFDSSALNATSVEHILARAIASGVTSATIFLDGGTNAGLASLSIQGQADYAALVLAGNTVSINP